MKKSIEVSGVLVQFIMGILILTHHADLRTLAWYYVIVGGFMTFMLIIAGLVQVSRAK